MRLPSWINPWWHVDYDIESPMAVAAASEALRRPAGRLRAVGSADRGLFLVRRGGFLNQFVRARASLGAAGAGTTGHVRIERPVVASTFFAFAFVFLVVYPFVVLMLSAAFNPSRLLQSAVFWVFGIVIWASVIGMNYAAARSEARDLERLIREALGGSA